MPTAPGRVVGTVLARADLGCLGGRRQALMWTLIVGRPGTVVILRVAHRAVMHLFRADASGEEDAAAAPMSAWAVVVDRGVAGAGDRRRHLAAELGLGAGRGRDRRARHAGDPPADRGGLHAVVILLVADLLWQLARTAIDRQLRQARPAAGRTRRASTARPSRPTRRAAAAACARCCRSCASCSSSCWPRWRC